MDEVGESVDCVNLTDFGFKWSIKRGDEQMWNMFDLSHILDMALLGFRHKKKVKKLNKNVSFYRNPYIF